ncbi:MAG: class F sortase [Candidatus Paceibacterota bacterium]|jgi:LPXTG-site transpeptidase (sortase) family protein
MKIKILSKLKLSIIIIFIFVFFAGVFLNFNSKTLIKNSFASVKEQKQINYLPVINAEMPARIKIPKIKINTNIEFVGLNSKGEVGVPNGPSSVAWFNLGPIPGEIGSAVIDGHSGWKNGPAVFDNLYKLKKGDKILIEDKKGMITTFVVSKIKKYDPKANASEVFVLNDGKAHLNLITCTGFWNKVLKSHSSRLVVFTDKLIE